MENATYVEIRDRGCECEPRDYMDVCVRLGSIRPHRIGGERVSEEGKWIMLVFIWDE